jgi:Cu2+-exporting ATPase
MTQTVQGIDQAAASLYTLVLDVGGMKCAGCVRAVEHRLLRYPGVTGAVVNLLTEVAAVECTSAIQIDTLALAQHLTTAGFPTQLRHDTRTEKIGRSPAIAFPELNSKTGQQPLQESRQQLWRVAIAASLVVISGLGHLNALTWINVPGFDNLWFHWGLATLALIGPGRTILIAGWQGARHGNPNMNTLVGLGTLAAYLTSCAAFWYPSLGWECFFDEPVMLVGAIVLGRALEQRAKHQALSALRSLLALQPQIARLITDPKHDQTLRAGVNSSEAGLSLNLDPKLTIELPVEQVKIGEWLQVLPGEAIPVDGEVVWGQTTVNESMLTGEPLPVAKQPGDLLTAGTLNQSGAVVLQATRTGRDTTLAHIITLVETAQTRKAPVQQLADRVAGYFTYVVIAIAILVFTFWYGIGTHLWSDVMTMNAGQFPLAISLSAHHAHATATTPLLLSLKLAIAVLVVSCPCALGLATPMAILVGTGMGAEQGLLIRGGDALERIRQIDTVIFDKTGTLTTGHPVLSDCLVLASEPLTAFQPHVDAAETLLQIAATVELGTTHPLATAILQKATDSKLSLLAGQAFHTQPGLGVSATVQEQTVLLGNRDWLRLQNIEIDSEAQNQAEVLEKAHKTVVFVALSGRLVGIMAVADTLRSESAATIATLKAMKLHVMLMTGDRREPAQSYAQAIGLREAEMIAEVRPDGKAAAIAELQSQGRNVAMVGDGINDAPALAQANVGIALHSGTDVAMETADIILMGDRLTDVVRSIQLGRATFNKIHQNLLWAFAYNIVGIPLAAGAFLPSVGLSLNPAAAGVMMSLSSIGVMINSLSLRRLPLNNVA